MKSALRLALFTAAACLIGVTTGHVLCSSVSFRKTIGLWSGRGALVALCDGIGVYEADLSRAQAEYADRTEDVDVDEEPKPDLRLTGDVAAGFELERLARHQQLVAGDVGRQLELTRSQFEKQAWLTALHSNGLSPGSLGSLIEANLRGRFWVEQKIAGALQVPPEECQTFYNGHAPAWARPPRIRASHIFFAAPPASPSELVEKKRAAAQNIIDRLARGEKFSDLVVMSEDESSKKRGGDLNFFSESRMPSDFWQSLRSRRVEDPPALIRTRLGFHVVQVTDIRPARPMSFEEARPAILLALQNEKRASAVTALREELLQRVQWVVEHPPAR